MTIENSIPSEEVHSQEVILKVENLKKYFPIKRGVFRHRVGDVKAVDGVSFNVYKGETLGLVGESGCGKTTTGRTIIRLYEPTEGQVDFQGVDLAKLTGAELRHTRRKIQMIFQDPYASLSPRMSVLGIVGEPMEIHHLVKTPNERKERVAELLEMVGLDPAFMNRFPHEFSGGQRQRIGVARALALNPDMIICDEPISALDVSIQAQVVNLLEELQAKVDLTYIFIAHDLSMVRHISNRVAVMYLGKIVELTDRETLYTNPLHPYTQALLSAVPVPNPEIEEKRQRTILEGDLPSPAHPPVGCNFNTRCPRAFDHCHVEEPPMIEVEPGHFCACHLVQPSK
ncbi:MAG: dipeptide ABC transporter ATP-binding protein [Anaerolineae bacterium]|jgi:oligopeptide transport system ATP-binding protein|nr:dipeptide ABC transporter ATP-binding protein [Anaerolineae bacterium]